MPESISVQRAQKMVRGTFMAAQGRQYAQITYIDAALRLWREDHASIDWDQMADPAAQALMMRRNLPPHHTYVAPELVRQQFLFWWQAFNWIGHYIETGTAEQLPSYRALDEYIVEIGGDDYVSSYLEEEVSAIKLMFDRYRSQDPDAKFGVDDALQTFAIPALIRADRHWVSDKDRRRPGAILADQSGSMLHRLLTESVAAHQQGWELTDLQRLYKRMAELLRCDEQFLYANFPTYPKLVAEFNAKHVGAEVANLHT